MIKVKFKNWLETESVKKQSKVGCRTVPVYSPVVKEDGQIELIQKGEHDLYAEIQSHKDSVDINRIIQRYSNGDVSALQAKVTQYLDVTEMPKTYAEMLNTVIAGEKFFAELPADVKDKFDNNFYKFASTIGQSDWLAAFGMVNKTGDAGNVSVSETGEAVSAGSGKDGE